PATAKASGAAKSPAAAQPAVTAAEAESEAPAGAHVAPPAAPAAQHTAAAEPSAGTSSRPAAATTQPAAATAKPAATAAKPAASTQKPAASAATRPARSAGASPPAEQSGAETQEVAAAVGQPEPAATGKPEPAAAGKPEPAATGKPGPAAIGKPGPAAESDAGGEAAAEEAASGAPGQGATPRPADTARRPGPPMHAGPITTPRPMAKAEVFHEGDHVVYPTHGVGKVERIATEEIAGHKLELIHITFEENRMTLRVPVAKARTAGLRKLATRKLFDEALAVLKGRARIKRTMWSRRAQEYEAKINSGDPLAIAEVVRDLHRNAGQPDQSFSERQIYEAAMERLAAELAALDKTDKVTAANKLTEFLKTV
ncbi:MAG TPA: CarD family transcriptional regulator, partial [Acetobacteraceae bacterium]|nr:CarD family transcriptional regulator [Acetobacteraceae bacterium]